MSPARSTPRHHGTAAPASSPSSAGAALLFAAAATAIAFLVVAGAAGTVLVLTGHDRVSTSTGSAPLLVVLAYALAALAAGVALKCGRRPPAAIAAGTLAASLVLLLATAAGAKLHDNPLRATQRAGTPSGASVTEQPSPSTSGQGQTPSLTSGQGQTPHLTSGQGQTPSLTSGRGQTPHLTSGQGQTPSRNTPETPRTPAQGQTPPLSSGQGQTPSLSPREVVTAYYADLDARDFRSAWRRLTPEVQRSFGGFAAWSKGFATTLASVPTQVSVEGDTVRLTLVAADRTACGGVVTTRYAVRWQLTGQRGVALSATPVTAPATTGCVSP
jgi:hypothetical protein